MSWRYTNEELNRMSGIQYQSLQDNPWKESGEDNLFLSKTTGLGSFGDSDQYNEFEEENALDNIMGNINDGIIRDIKEKIDKKTLQEETIIFNTTSTDATKGILEETSVTKILFSPINVKTLQDSIRFYVFKSTRNNISYQSDEQLYVIMQKSYYV